MKIRNQVISLTVFMCSTFLCLIFLGAHALILQSYLDLEHRMVDKNLTRVDQILKQTNDSLLKYTVDWSHWDEAYEYVQGKNPEFVANNMKLMSFVNSNINLITYWDLKGKLIFGSAIDTNRKALMTFPSNLNQALFSNDQFIQKTLSSGVVSGYVLLGDKIMSIASSTIRDANSQEPSLGIAVVGRYISPSEVQVFSNIMGLSLDLFTLNEIHESPNLEQVFNTMENQQIAHSMNPIDNTKLEAYSTIKDLNGKSIGFIRLNLPRNIYLTGLKTINYFMLSILVLGIIYSIFIYRILSRLVIKRLERLEGEISDFNHENQLSTRVSVSGNDEISTVAAEINGMLSLIENSQNQLEQRIYERTKELEKTNVQLQQEISDRRTIEKELVISKEHLVKLAHYDSLTGLPNRIFFNEILNKAINHSQRQKKLLAILFIDLDGFKTINDEVGHAAGDIVLREIAHRFSTTLRAGDILARLGGDEFIILLNDVAHPKFASPVAEKLLQAVKRPVKVHSHEFELSASIGICIFPNDGISLEDLQRNADIAMYKAKHTGGGVFQYFTKEMNAQAHEHIQIEHALHRALETQAFQLFYQPKLNLSDGTLSGVEALIRWEDPVLGNMDPSKFITIAEESGLIMAIGEWALREACLANKRWQDAGYSAISISVNISPKQFRFQDIAQLVKKTLEETGLDPKYLELEITETTMMDDPELAIHRLQEIRQLGVAISIDDFGTGYTSISYLKEYPISLLKIDRSFVKGVPNDTNDLAIISAVISLAHNLGLRVVAEGVETEEQMNYLADNQCDMIQGYFFSRPLPEAKVILQFTKTASAESSA